MLQVLGMVKPPRMDTWLLRPPILVGERIVWLGSGSGLPQCGIVRWIGKLPEMGSDWTIGVELVGIFFIYALFNNAVSSADCIALDFRMLCENWVGKVLEESGCSQM
jgi:hypothetical protein